MLRASAGETLPGALVTVLRDEAVACGWMRASGVLRDVELRAYDPQVGALGGSRRISGAPSRSWSLEGSIGLAGGDPSGRPRALLARETNRGLETLAGEIASATVVALEALITALDDLTLVRAVDEAAGLWMLDPATGEGLVRGAPPEGPPGHRVVWGRGGQRAGGATAGPATAQTRRRASPPSCRRNRPTRTGQSRRRLPGAGRRRRALRVRPRRRGQEDDGDRLHLKIHKDSRVREIALEMLRVSRLGDTDDGKRRFRLERRM